MPPLNPHPSDITPEQILELRAMSYVGELPPNVLALADIALGYRFRPEERADARTKLALVYSTVRGPLADLLLELALWAGARRFDDDQDPGTDTPDERLVRSYFRWEALR